MPRRVNFPSFCQMIFRPFPRSYITSTPIFILTANVFEKFNVSPDILEKFSRILKHVLKDISSFSKKKLVSSASWVRRNSESSTLIPFMSVFDKIARASISVQMMKTGREIKGLPVLHLYQDENVQMSAHYW